MVDVHSYVWGGRYQRLMAFVKVEPEVPNGSAALSGAKYTTELYLMASPVPSATMTAEQAGVRGGRDRWAWGGLGTMSSEQDVGSFMRGPVWQAKDFISQQSMGREHCAI